MYPLPQVVPFPLHLNEKYRGQHVMLEGRGQFMIAIVCMHVELYARCDLVSKLLIHLRE